MAEHRLIPRESQERIENKRTSTPARRKQRPARLHTFRNPVFKTKTKTSGWRGSPAVEHLPSIRPQHCKGKRPTGSTQLFIWNRSRGIQALSTTGYSSGGSRLLWTLHHFLVAECTEPSGKSCRQKKKVSGSCSEPLKAVMDL